MINPFKGMSFSIFQRKSNEQKVNSNNKGVNQQPEQANNVLQKQVKNNSIKNMINVDVRANSKSLVSKKTQLDLHLEKFLKKENPSGKVYDYADPEDFSYSPSDAEKKKENIDAEVEEKIPSRHQNRRNSKISVQEDEKLDDFPEENKLEGEDDDEDELMYADEGKYEPEQIHDPANDEKMLAQHFADALIKSKDVTCQAIVNQATPSTLLALQQQLKDPNSPLHVQDQKMHGKISALVEKRLDVDITELKGKQFDDFVALPRDKAQWKQVLGKGGLLCSSKKGANAARKKFCSEKPTDFLEKLLFNLKKAQVMKKEHINDPLLLLCGAIQKELDTRQKDVVRKASVAKGMNLEGPAQTAPVFTDMEAEQEGDVYTAKAQAQPSKVMEKGIKQYLSEAQLEGMTETQAQGEA